MAVELEIRDGNPWWLSPDIWIVPGDDPEGAPGTPRAGQPAFMWARVTNNGHSGVQNASVRFYWANPSSGVNRTTANLVGVSYVNLAAGETADVLCLTPWIPVLVNDGHECVLAEAFHSSLDPLPTTDAFNVPGDRHVAQRNLTVLASSTGMVVMRAEFHNAERHDREFAIRLRQGKLEELEPMRKTLGTRLPNRDGRLLKAAFVEERCPDMKRALDGHPDSLTIRVGARRSVERTIVAHFEGPGVVLHVEQWDPRRQRLVGGLSALAIAGKEKS